MCLQIKMNLPTEINDLIMSFVYGDETSQRNQHQKVMTQLNHVYLFPLIAMSRGWGETVSEKVDSAHRFPLHRLKPFVQINRWTGRVEEDDD